MHTEVINFEIKLAADLSDEKELHRNRIRMYKTVIHENRHIAFLHYAWPPRLNLF